MGVTISNYTAGRAKEYKVMKFLDKLGYTTLRTAGSHGDWDVLAYKNQESLHVIQVKYNKEGLPTKHELERFEKAALPKGTGAYLVTFKRGQSSPFRVYERACGEIGGVDFRDGDGEAWI